ncbi:hypothetical protein P5673_021749 [Acropora cervicornis]|uniref:Smoothelin domain-containing protein n=1 Tax=Acropora cervicornis TaxID=6130 RepID=A0AAD9Q7U0_ACRCE|nr:hypothetical protein P5673_021749 [Acropora cervicornis]
MADEEAVLKKKLEDTTDFDERRAIRQQLRELRKKKLDALESSPSMTDRPRRRERARKEEQITITTEMNTVDGYSSEQKTQTKIETNHKCEVITDGLAENDKNGLTGNGIENGNQDTTSAVTDICQNENEFKHDIKINRDEKPLHNEIEEVVSVAQELPKENEMAINESSETSDKELEKPEEEETEEVELTPEVVEKIEDIDMLEKLQPKNVLKKARNSGLRLPHLGIIETSMENENVLILGKGTKAKNSMNLPGNDSNNNRTPTRNCKPSDNEEIEANPLESAFVNSETTVIGSKELAAAEEIQTNGEHLCGSEKSESDCEADETLSTQSSLTPEVNLKPDLPKKIPPIPPRPSTTSSTGSKGELMGDFKGRILGKSATPAPRDLTRKLKSQPEQVDFRGQLKKTGLRADKDLTVQGKRKQQLQEGNFHVQLKSTGGDTSRNLSAVQSVGKKKDSPAQFDFRGQLQRTSNEHQTKKTPPTRPPPTYLNRETERGASPLAISEKAKPHSEGDVKPAETLTKDVRKISSADLFNMLSKPVENSGEGYLVQRGLKKAEASKANPQKFKSVSVDTSLEDENFKARMAQRKERSDKQFYSGKGSKDERKMSAGVETKDFKAILKKAGAKQSRAIESSTGQVTKEQPTSNNAGKRSENVAFDVKQKEQKDKGIVERTTEKQVTEVEQLDGAQVTTQTAKTTEVHKTAGGTTMTVTKTTRTTEEPQLKPCWLRRGGKK